MFSPKFYAALFAVILGLLTAFNQAAQGQTIINPSFETDNVPPAPGYGAITGWTGGSGINNATGPFADNGTIPDGQKAAFLQGGTMGQTVSGFTVGASYRLRYYENRRSATAANLRVTVGGATVVATHEVAAVGGTNPYVLKISERFTATTAALEIAFITSGAGDYTVLLDKIEIGRDLIVTNNNDSGAGSLRQTIIDAPAGSAISFSDALGDAISLSGDIGIDKNLTIIGPGADALILSGGGVYVPPGVTTAVTGLTISDGAGIYNRGNLTLTDSIVRRNTGRSFFVLLAISFPSNITEYQIRGGGIYNRGTLTIAGSVINENWAQYGGGIYNQGGTEGGTMNITGSTVSQNTSQKAGGGIYNGTLDTDGSTQNDVYGNVTVNNSSITGNSASILPQESPLTNRFDFRAGGGLANEGGTSTLTNSTVSGNLEFRACPGGCLPATGGRGIVNRGALNHPPGVVNLINTTVADSVYSRGTVNARNSIVGLSFDGTLNSQGYNLISNTLNTTITGDTTGNIVSTDARLGPLGYYGGLTQTRALLSGSPAINAGNTATSPAFDQRGAARVGTADIGAFELNNSTNGGNFGVRLPDAFTETAYSYLIVPGRGSFNYTVSGGAPTGFSLIDEEGYVSIGGRTGQTGVFNFSVTATNGTDSFVTDYTVRVLDSGLPPLPGGCRLNPVVTNKVGIGEGSLRQAVIDACAGSTISFSAAVRGTIDLTRGRLVIDKNLTIQGPGAGVLTIRNAAGVQNNGSFLVNSAVTAVISGLTVRDGFTSGIRNNGTLTLTNMSVSDNPGSGIINSGTLSVANSIISRNGTIGDGLTTSTDSGGGISSITGALTVIDSTISDNYASNGGGISATNVTINNSTIRNNRGGAGGSERGGAGLRIFEGTATVTNSTVSGNLSRVSSNTNGGAIRIEGGTLRLINSTVAYNQTTNAGARGFVGGIYHNSGATLITRNSIIAMNDATNNIFGFGTLTSEGYNLIGSISQTITGDTTGNIVGTSNAPIDARLAPLGFYGGLTETHALLSGSPAINAGNTATSPAADQRGAARVGTADIGAFELNNSVNGGNFVAGLPDGVIQKIYSYAIPTSRQLRMSTLPPFTASYLVTDGALPTGISLSADGTLSGTPTVSGVFNFSVTATSGANSVVTNYRLQIYALPRGSFDSADCSFISGWAWDPQQPNTPISVNIYADDILVGSVSADQFRQDLLNAGIGNGVHGFSLATPANLKDGQPHQIRVRIVSATSDINGSPRTITCATPPDLTVTKTHVGNFTQGDTGRTYSITVMNSGGTATSGGVSLSDSLPNGLTATSINGTGWNCNFSNLTCTRNDALGANTSYPAITLIVNVASNAPGSVINFASVSGGGETNTGNNQAADPTTINAAPRYAISGAVKYGTTTSGQPDSFVSGVNLSLTGSANSSLLSDGSGNYFLSNLLGGNYTVTPTKTGEVRGINSLDATRIQQHLVGMTTLSANQLIAADTDGSTAVNSLDATRIQQRAVGMQTSNIIGQWKFVPASRQYNALGSNASGQDYQAVLVGEVSGNWITAASFADTSQNEEENEVLPGPSDHNQIAQRFTDNLFISEWFTNNLFKQVTEDVGQTSDSLSNESPAILGIPVIQVSLPSNATRGSGSTVTIPINIGVIPAGSSIESFDFSVFYNAAVLQPTASAGSNMGTLSANCSVLPFSPVAGRVVVSGACAQAVTTGSGVLYNLAFNVIGAVNQTSGLSFTNPANNTNTFQFNNGTPVAATTSGLFTVLAPTAASVSVSGRVLTSGVRGLTNATVTMTGASGTARSTRTGTFGYFRFDGVEAGQTYVFNVNSKRFTFVPLVATVMENLTDLNFTAQ